MRFNPHNYPVSPSKVENLRERIERLHLDLNNVEETFTKGSGKGGQKINKTSSAVCLRYPSLQLVVKMSKDRSQAINRFLGLRELVERIEMKTAKSKPKKELQRCPWALGDALMLAYHDKEWGVPVKDDQLIFEFLVLESFQAGLSWRTILHKRENFRKEFAGFDPREVARFGDRETQRLLNDAGIVRNRLKIASAINNAQRFLEVQKEFGTFAKYMWSWVKGKPLVHYNRTIKDLLATNPEGDAWSKDLKARGFRFLGPTVIYAHMQATGMVNDHLVACSFFQRA